MVRRAGGKKSKTQNRKGLAGPAQRGSPGFSLHSRIPTRYPLFPRQLQFSSTWTRTLEVDLGATTYNQQVGLFDFLGKLPEYALEAYNLYRYSRIVGVDLVLIVAGESDEANQNYAFEAAMARVPYDQATTLVPQELRLVRGSRYGLSSTSGQNRLTLKASYGSFDELGNPVLDRQFWQTAVEALSPTPPEANRPAISVAVRSVNGNRGLASINLSVVYHMQFFELEYKRLPNSEISGKLPPTKRNPPKSITDAGAEDTSFEDGMEVLSDKKRPAPIGRFAKRT